MNSKTKPAEVRQVEAILLDANRAEELTDQEVLATLRHVRQLALMLDSAFEIPGTNIKFGWDSIIGLVPGIGDAFSAALSGYIILLARRCGISKWVTGRMVANTLIDMGVGVIPLAGDVFDVAFKANRKNVALLEKHLHKRFPHLTR